MHPQCVYIVQWPSCNCCQGMKQNRDTVFLGPLQRTSLLILALYQALQLIRAHQPNSGIFANNVRKNCWTHIIFIYTYPSIFTDLSLHDFTYTRLLNENIKKCFILIFLLWKSKSDAVLMDLVLHLIPYDMGDNSSYDDNNAAEKIAWKVIMEVFRLDREVQIYVLNVDYFTNRTSKCHNTIKTALRQYEKKL